MAKLAEINGKNAQGFTLIWRVYCLRLGQHYNSIVLGWLSNAECKPKYRGNKEPLTSFLLTVHFKLDNDMTSNWINILTCLNKVDKSHLTTIRAIPSVQSHKQTHIDDLLKGILHFSSIFYNTGRSNKNKQKHIDDLLKEILHSFHTFSITQVVRFERKRWFASTSWQQRRK